MKEYISEDDNKDRNVCQLNEIFIALDEDRYNKRRLIVINMNNTLFNQPFIKNSFKLSSLKAWLFQSKNSVMIAAMEIYFKELI